MRESIAIYLLGETPRRRLPRHVRTAFLCEHCLDNIRSSHGAGDLCCELNQTFQIRADIHGAEADKLRELATFPMKPDVISEPDGVASRA